MGDTNRQQHPSQPTRHVYNTDLHPDDNPLETDALLLLLPPLAVSMVSILGLLHRLPLQCQSRRHLVQCSVCVQAYFCGMGC